MSAAPHGSKLHQYILIGLVLGAIAGITVNQTAVDGILPGSWLWVLKNITDPLGKVFFNLLFMTVIPLVFCSLGGGVARLGDLGHVGRMGARTITYFLATTAVAVVVGLAFVNLVRPGDGMPLEQREKLMAQYGGDATKKLEKSEGFGVDTFVNIIPRNPLEAAVKMDMLAIIFVALMVGIGITRLKPEHNKLLLDLMDSIGEVMVFIISTAMKFAPIGVFCLIFGTTARFGIGLLQQLGWYVMTVLAGLLVMSVVVYPLIVKFLCGWSPIVFFDRIRNVILTAFSTSSSNATLPTSLRVAEEKLGVPAPVAGFVLPLGATMNMNGTALFEGITVLFLAQVFGVSLSLPDQIIVVVMCVLTAVGAAGIPGGSIPMLALVLVQFNIPGGAIAIILGVDRILDMCRTTVNNIGDMTSALFIARTEGAAATPPMLE